MAKGMLQDDQKLCLACAEIIKEEALKCKWCGEWMEKVKQANGGWKWSIKSVGPKGDSDELEYRGARKVPYQSNSLSDP